MEKILNLLIEIFCFFCCRKRKCKKQKDFEEDEKD